MMENQNIFEDISSFQVLLAKEIQRLQMSSMAL